MDRNHTGKIHYQEYLNMATATVKEQACPPTSGGFHERIEGHKWLCWCRRSWKHGVCSRAHTHMRECSHTHMR
eukprot:5679244-Pleurochrysis_carterae.AAC.1